jgi:hypothetical protein
VVTVFEVRDEIREVVEPMIPTVKVPERQGRRPVVGRVCFDTASGWPRSRSRCSMPAPVASDIRSPFSASSASSSCSAGGPSPAATSSALSSLRSSATP